ncbi:hypothetical protein OH77DRAFT_447956 [Trametes cingulata]|nr:hypothetical protein OH77DRAFT_447956 [Trametes cingulata]
MSAKAVNGRREHGDSEQFVRGQAAVAMVASAYCFFQGACPTETPCGTSAVPDPHPVAVKGNHSVPPPTQAGQPRPTKPHLPSSRRCHDRSCTRSPGGSTDWHDFVDGGLRTSRPLVTSLPRPVVEYIACHSGLVSASN